MKANLKFNDFYMKLTDSEKQICDLCKDWNLGECEKCEFAFNILNEEEINDNRRKMVGRRKHARN